MGEYFKSKKLGTCDNLMYVTRKEIEERVSKYPNEINDNNGSLPYLKDYLNLDSNFMYRFEFKDELDMSWDEDREPFKSITIDIDKRKVAVPHRDFHQRHLDNGECFNLPFCFYSDKAFEMGIKKISSPGNIKVDIIGERYTNDNPNGYTILKCNCCGEMFALSEDECVEVVRALKLEGYDYEASLIKPKFKRVKVSREEFIKGLIEDEDILSSIIEDLVGEFNVNANNVKDLMLDKLNSFTTEELNSFSQKHLCNCEIY